MKKENKILLILMISVIGFGMIVTSVSGIFANFGLFIFFSIGLGLLVGPIVGILLSFLDIKDNNKKHK